MRPAIASQANAAIGIAQTSRVRHGMRIALALFFAFGCTASFASAQPAIDISPPYIAGIPLGATQAQARAVMTKPVRVDRLEDGYMRFVSTRQKLESYFRTGTKGVAVVTTWNRQLQTERQVGPCSTLAALKRAYGPLLAPFMQGGKTVAYRYDTLIFTLKGTRVGAVALGRGTPAMYVALSATQCA